jgi:hypothetical protein
MTTESKWRVLKMRWAPPEWSPEDENGDIIMTQHERNMEADLAEKARRRGEARMEPPRERVF